MSDVDFDDPATFRGQLQRGRGIAVRRAPGEREAADAVYECVIDDPRWDRQTEDRDDHLAGLIVTLDLSLGPVERHLVAFDDDDPWDIHLLLNVLAALTVAGRKDASGVLRHYALGGKHWNSALCALHFDAPREVPGLWNDLVDEVLAQRSDEELRAVVDRGDDDWMRSLLGRRPRIERFYDQDDVSPDPAKIPGAEFRNWLRTLSEVPRDDLVRSVTTGRQRRWALEELGRRGDEIVLDLVEDPSLRNAAGYLPGSGKALGDLGTAAVPRARGWLSGDESMRRLGVGVLAASGDHTDVPVLMAALRLAFEDDDEWCAAESPAEGLGRLQVAEAAPLLLEAWERTVHSYARGSFLNAMQGCAPQLAETLADEGLDDCESAVRGASRAITGRSTAA